MDEVIFVLPAMSIRVCVDRASSIPPVGFYRGCGSLLLAWKEIRSRASTNNNRIIPNFCKVYLSFFSTRALCWRIEVVAGERLCIVCTLQNASKSTGNRRWRLTLYGARQHMVRDDGVLKIMSIPWQSTSCNSLISAKHIDCLIVCGYADYSDS